ncbi:MAG: tRNA pseudouridine(55) synthase TruB [Phototrophicales bacterium]|nr:MAG: tRNA pseudouridine(55) synthase TruB [Phototrophicales bacterium]
MTELGFLNINKPLGMTSHDVVNWVRKHTNMKKVGHAGTLDPMATGVLVICWGKATRLSQYVMGHSKTYIAELTFGIETDTYDAEGKVVREDSHVISRADVEGVLPLFRGEVLQRPPMFSAIKKDGKKLYELARRGQEVEIEPRPVHIESLEIISWDFPRCLIKVTCSAGTYIRSLAYDIGKAVQVGAHLSALTRTTIGNFFTLENAVSLEELAKALEQGKWQSYLVSPRQALYDIPAIVVDDVQVQHLKQGRFLRLSDEYPSLLQVYDSQEHFIALIEKHPNYPHFWKPSKVFA